MADIPQLLRSWSTTASNNLPTGATPISTGLDDNLRSVQATIRQFLASPATTIASAATVDLSTADGKTVPISGTSTVVGLGTESAGIPYLLSILGTQVWKNSSAMPLPSGADLTLLSGDFIAAESKGAGNWLIPFITRANGQPLVAGSAGSGVTVVGPVIGLDIHGLNATTVPLSTYEVPVYSQDSSVNKKSTLANLLTKPTTQVFTSGSGTYVTPAGVARLFVRLIGGGGGGGGAPTGTGTAGGSSTFSTFAAGGGTGGAGAAGGVAGGTASGGTINIPGGGSGPAVDSGTSGVAAGGGVGGSSFFGGGGAGGGIGVGSGLGGNGSTNSGGGGGGAGAANAQNSGSGGGSGGYVEGNINSPSATYTYSVGTGGTGAAGAANTGGNGAAGIIIVQEFYA